MSGFEKFNERWYAINDLERVAHANIEDHSRRDVAEQPWTDEDRYFAAIRLTHALARLERIEGRQKVIYEAVADARGYAETTRWLVISAIAGAIISMILR